MVIQKFSMQMDKHHFYITMDHFHLDSLIRNNLISIKINIKNHNHKVKLLLIQILVMKHLIIFIQSKKMILSLNYLKIFMCQELWIYFYRLKV